VSSSVTQIAGRNALITGAASGIGRQVALRLARRGANVVLWDIHADNLAAAVDQLKRATGRIAHGYACDVSDREAVCAAAAQVKRQIGPVHILVNSAGVVTGKPFLECSDEAVERTLAVNTLGLFWTCKSFLPDMIRAGFGHVVTVASAAGVVGVARLSDYCASKWAAVGFDESLRMELRKAAPGVKTTIVCTHYVDTGMFRGVRSRFPWLLPILKEDAVAERIVQAIRRNRPRVWMPPLVYLVPLLRILPVRLFDGVATLLGVHSAMDEFLGRSGDDRGKTRSS
jgi:all-trans-retinol dehydrogenase (NAD+)